MKSSYSEPTILWRLSHRDGRVAHAVIVPRWSDASAVWFIDDKPEEARDFEDWESAVKWMDSVRVRLSGNGWR